MLGKITLQIEGVNVANTLNQIKDKYKITNIKKVHNTITNLTVPANNYTKIFDYFRLKCYNVNIIQFSPFLRFELFVQKYLLQIITLVLCVLVLCTFCNMVLGAKFLNNLEYNNQIEEVLKQNNVYGKFKGSVDVNNLELKIIKAIPKISLVNISFNGCFLVVNYTLKTEALTPTPIVDGPIIAQNSGVVSRLFVTSGTPLVSVNSYVTKGQVLVANYFVDKDGNNVSCPAQADVYVYSWQSSTVKFCEDTIQYVPTGKQMEYTSLSFLNKTIEGKQYNVTYENYNTLTKTKYLTTFGLPVKIVYTIYQQTQPQKVHTDFNTQQDSLKMQAKENVLAKINIQDILEEKYTVSYVGDVYFVTYYAKTENLIT